MDKRKSRHSRDREKRAYSVTPNVIAVLNYLARYKYLRSSMIAGLLPKRNTDGLSRTLRRMYDAGLIDKPREQRRGYNDRYCPDIYMLDRGGEEQLVTRGLNPKKVTRLYRQATDGPIKNFAHAMMICDTMASIEIGAGDRLIPWTDIIERTNHPNPMKLECSIRHRFGERTEAMETAIVSDGLFGIRYSDGKVAIFAVEAEHFNPIEPSTLGRSSTLKKVLAYQNVIRRQQYKEQLKIPNLRVLLVYPSAERAKHAVALIEKLCGQSPLFLVTHVPVQEELLKAPPPFPQIFTTPLLRAGLPPITLAE